MAEPKGGPVKPPTLDLDPKHSRTHPTKPKSNSSDQARSSSQYQASAQSKSTPRAAHKSKLSTTTAAIVGAFGGALLALLLIIPLLMFGVFLPSEQNEKYTEIDTRLDVILNLIKTNQEQAGQELVDYLDAMDQQVHTLRQNLNQDLSLQSGQLQAQVDQISSTQQNLLTQNDSLSEQGASLLTQFEAAQSNTPSSSRPFDATEIEQSLIALNARFDTIAVGTSAPDIQEILDDFKQLQSQFEEQLQDMSASLSVSTQQSNTAQQELSTRLLSHTQQIEELTQLAAQRLESINQQTQLIEELTRADPYDANLAVQPTTQIEIIQPISELSPQAYKIQSDLNSAELALANGQPFLLELQSLSAQFPNLQISDPILQSATTGLPTPTKIISQFHLVIPDMLAVRPAEPRAGWISQIGNSVKSALAIRPTGLTNGDQIENMLNQSLAALDRTDFYTAYSILEQLPVPMFEVTGDLANQIRQFGDSQKLIEEIKQSLTQAPTPAGEVATTNDTNETSP